MSTGSSDAKQQWWQPDRRGVWTNVVSAVPLSIVAFLLRWWVNRAYGRLGLTSDDAGFSYVSLFQVMAVFAGVLAFGALLILLIVCWAIQFRAPGFFLRILDRARSALSRRFVVKQTTLENIMEFAGVVAVGCLIAGLVAVLYATKALGLSKPVGIFGSVVFLFFELRGAFRATREFLRHRWMRRMVVLAAVVGLAFPLVVSTVRGTGDLRERIELVNGTRRRGWLAWPRVAVDYSFPLPSDTWWMTTPDGRRRLVDVLRWDSWLEVIEPCAAPPFIKQRFLASAVTLEPFAPSGDRPQSLCTDS